MTNLKLNPAAKNFVSKQLLFSTFFSDRMNGERSLFATKEEAVIDYESIDVMEVTRESDRYWHNNKEGYEAEITELKALPVSLIEELNEAETEEEMEELWNADDLHHTHAERIESKFSFLSDEFDEKLGKNGEFLVKEKKVAGITYGTSFGDIETIEISAL